MTQRDELLYICDRILNCGGLATRIQMDTVASALTELLTRPEAQGETTAAMVKAGIEAYRQWEAGFLANTPKTLLRFEGHPCVASVTVIYKAMVAAQERGTPKTTRDVLVDDLIAAKTPKQTETPRTEAARKIRAMDRSAGEVAFDILAEDLERTLHAKERELAELSTDAHYLSLDRQEIKQAVLDTLTKLHESNRICPDYDRGWKDAIDSVRINVEREFQKTPSKPLQSVSAAPQGFWVVEKLDDKGVGGMYWDGGSSVSFVSDINKAIHFCRHEDAFWTRRSYGWDNVKITEHLYFPTAAPQEGKEIVEALLKYHERFENFGMQGYGPDKEVFYCEDCKQEHKDYTQIQHNPGCRAAALLKAIREYESPSPPAATPRGDGVHPKPEHCLLDIPMGTPCAMAGHCLSAAPPAATDGMETVTQPEGTQERLWAEIERGRQLREAAQSLIHEFEQQGSSLSGIAAEIAALRKALAAAPQSGKKATSSASTPQVNKCER